MPQHRILPIYVLELYIGPQSAGRLNAEKPVRYYDNTYNKDEHPCRQQDQRQAIPSEHRAGIDGLQHPDASRQRNHKPCQRHSH